MAQELGTPSGDRALGSGGASALAAVPMGKTLPHAQQLEGPLLGALMLSTDLAGDLQDFLRPEHFYVPRNQRIYQAIVSVLEANLPVDLYTVIQRLEDERALAEVGGAAYVARLTTLVASTAHAGEHAQIVVQKFVQRRLIQVLGDIQARAYDGQADVYELIEAAEAGIFELHHFGRRKEGRPIREVVDETLAMVREASLRKDGLSGISTGFDNLDMVTQGWQKGNLIIIGGRPSMGKTAFVLTMARNMSVRNGTGVAIFSLEMADTELALRLMIAESELDGKMVKAGQLSEVEWQRLNEASEVLSGANLYFDDTQQLTVNELRAKARRLKSRHNIGLIVVDYLQLMETPKEERGGVREQDVGKVSRALKGMAKELEVPVIALAQLNRMVEIRGDKRPKLSDLRESGSIEQDADIVAMVHRPEFYQQEAYPDGTPTRGMADLLVVKNRHGALASLNFRFIPGFAQFKDVGDRVDHYEGGAKGSKGAAASGQVYEARMSATASSGAEEDSEFSLKLPATPPALELLGDEPPDFGQGY